MSTQEQIGDTISVEAENIGGIDETDVTFSKGVTILTGRNATNRTSLLQAIAAALGSEQATLKGDADEGHVELSLGEATYTRTLQRRNGQVVYDGDPYLEDAEVADLFAFLFRSNPARRAVERGDDFADIIMRPVDTAAIESKIEEYRAERREIDEKLERIEEKSGRLPSLEERRQSLQDKIDEKQAELEAKLDEIEATDRDVEATREEKAELDEALEQLQDIRSNLEETRFDIESEEQSIEALEDDLEEFRKQIDSLPDAPMGEVEEIESELSRLREQRRSVETTLEELRSIIQFNEEMVDGTADIASEIRHTKGDADAADGSVTDRLVEESDVVCWTCGSTVGESAIEETIERLQSLLQEKQRERSDLQAEIQELQSEKSEYEETQRERSQLERRIDQAETELEQRETRLEELRDERERLQERVSEVEAEIDELQQVERTELLDLHKEANQLEFDLGQLEQELESVSKEIDSIQADIDQKDDLRARRETVSEELDSLRTRIEDIERDAVEQFNSHMETVLDLLDYENLARIWIERRQTTVREGREKVEQSVFDLHVVRESADGTTYEDTLDHLSESEREVTGLIFALAGFLAHEVYEEVPFLVIDSMEAIDAERIARLIDYLNDFAECTVVALLPEDAQAVDDDYERVTEI